jgi:hypothetical protein
LILKPVALSAQSSALVGQRISGQHQGQRILFSARKVEDMTAPTISATPKKALDQRATLEPSVFSSPNIAG